MSAASYGTSAGAAMAWKAANPADLRAARTPERPLPFLLLHHITSNLPRGSYMVVAAVQARA